MSSQHESSGSRPGGTATAPGAGPPGGRKTGKDQSKVTDKPLDRVVGGAPVSGERRSFFEIYKRGQGYHTRVGTAVGAGILILAGGNFLYDQLDLFENQAAWTLWVQVGIPVAFVVILGLLLYWVVGVHRRSCDFMIATEGEMKKVSWSSKKELIGSTKVVIVFSLLISAMLFVTDLVFMTIFSMLNVLRLPPALLKMFGFGE
jgi:preprotein translocase subunit SecE